MAVEVVTRPRATREPRHPALLDGKAIKDPRPDLGGNRRRIATRLIGQSLDRKEGNEPAFCGAESALILRFTKARRETRDRGAEALFETGDGRRKGIGQ